MQTSIFEAPRNVSHQETLDEDQQFAYWLKRGVRKERMTPGMEEYQGRSEQELGTARHDPNVG
jgi:hypothetical protein